MENCRRLVAYSKAEQYWFDTVAECVTKASGIGE
jgi:hypothetical protein